MKYYTARGRVDKEVRRTLSDLDRVVLEKCKRGLNILRVIKCGRPYENKFGSREFASSEEVVQSVRNLVKLGLLERR